MSEEKTPVTHWKKLTNPNYIGAHDLQPGQELKVVIDSVGTEMVKNDKGEASSCIVMRFKKGEGTTKPLIVNKTNCKIIEQVLDTPYIENWPGSTIILYSAKVNAFGKMTDAIRVKNQKA